MPFRRPSLRLLGAVIASTALVAACGGGSAAGPPAHKAAPVVTQAPPPPPTWPLTGLVVDDVAKSARPALVVKIDNAPQARPQAGLDAADVVFEEVVEGGITRFLAVFHSRDAAAVGPVRSVRPIDPDIVTPLGGLFAYSGGADKFKAMIRRAPVRLVGFDEATGAYSKDHSRRAPYNLFTATDRLWALAEGDKAPPALFEYLDEGEVVGGPNERPMAGFSAVLGVRTTAGWDWDAAANLWRRTTNGSPHVGPDGAQLGFENVVLQLVDYRATTDIDVSGSQVPEADIVGQGPLFLLAQGKLVPGRWAKADASTPTTFMNEYGAALELVPGRTWVEFMPHDALTQTR